MSKDIILNNLIKSKELLDAFIKDPENINKIAQAGDIICDAFNAGNKIISCGNGGSMSDAMHFAEEMTGRFKEDRKSLPAIAISDPSYLSCAANDFGYDMIFARFIEGMGKENDVLIAISTSGNSQNIIEAIKKAQLKGLKTIALTGKDGGKAATLSDMEIRAPFSKYSDRVQEIHIKVIHSIIDYVEQKLEL